MMSASMRCLLSIVPACVLHAACSSSAQRVQALPPAPTQPVQTAALEPPAPPEGFDPLLEAEAEATVAVAPPEPSSAIELGRTDLIGGWAVSSGGDTCQLFMSLTQWEGGYRASTRGCSNPRLASISAWELSGNRVQLKGEGGAPLATLAAAEETRFNGATADGDAITVQR
jgi:hypothetical protein